MREPFAAKSDRSLWRRRVAVALLISPGVCAAIALATLFFGGVQGQEFSPDTFRRRSYWYFEIPLLRVQVFPVVRDDATGEVEAYLAAQSIVRPRRTGNPRWDLAVRRRALAAPWLGDAAILCRYLDAVDEQGRAAWISWSVDHPRLAQVFWPRVAAAARAGHYLAMPELFELAACASGPRQLGLALDACLARQLRWLADQRRRAGDARAAERLARRAAHWNRAAASGAADPAPQAVGEGGSR